MARTGLHRAAIYGTFGNKKRLFEALLTRYRAKVTAERLAPLRSRDAALAEVKQFFGHFRPTKVVQSGCPTCVEIAVDCRLDTRRQSHHPRFQRSRIPNNGERR